MSPLRRPRPAGVDKALSLRLLVLLPVFTLALRLFGFRRLYLFLLRRSNVRRPRAVPTADLHAEAERIAATVVRVNRHVLPYESRCLLESLVLMWLLRRSGIAAELFLGVRTIMGPFEAHAWVEYGGRVLNDVDGVRGVYEAFDLRRLGVSPTADGPQTQMT